MNWLNETVFQLGQGILGMCLLFFIGWVFSKSPLFAWVIKFFLLVAWFVFAVAGPLYLTVFVYLPKQEYFAGIGCLLLGALGAFTWFGIAFPEFKKTLSDTRKSLILWR